MPLKKEKSVLNVEVFQRLKKGLLEVYKHIYVFRPVAK